MTDRPPQAYPEHERPVAVFVTGDLLHVTLQDGRVIATPLDWYPRLVDATPEQLADVMLMIDGIHWPQLDEDLLVRGMLEGVRPPQRRSPEPA